MTELPRNVMAVALASARAAAGPIREGYGRVRGIKEKTSSSDLVTATDVAAEEEARKVIREAFPQHLIVGEEHGVGGGTDADGESGSAGAGGSAPPGPTAPSGKDHAHHKARIRESTHVWYIDPLDGTTNFVHGVPILGPSIAYAHKGELTAAVVYNPLTEELFRAQRGQGAFLNDEAIGVDGASKLSESLLATGFQYDATTGERLNLKHFSRLMAEARNVRALGSAALHLAYVAAGRLSGFWELRLGPWDTAAGALLVTEAGGRVTHTDGSEFDPLNPDVVATNGTIHGVLLEQLASD